MVYLYWKLDNPYYHNDYTETPEIIADLHQRFCVILKVINSRNHIDVRLFREFEIETNLILVNKFKWMGLNYTLHAFIGHGWETILKNGGQGLAQKSEKALEAAHQVHMARSFHQG